MTKLALFKNLKRKKKTGLFMDTNICLLKDNTKMCF